MENNVNKVKRLIELLGEQERSPRAVPTEQEAISLRQALLDLQNDLFINPVLFSLYESVSDRRVLSTSELDNARNFLNTWLDEQGALDKPTPDTKGAIDTVDALLVVHSVLSDERAEERLGTKTIRIARAAIADLIVTISNHQENQND